MRCQTCGFENDPRARFCESCGTNLFQASAPPPPYRRQVMRAGPRPYAPQRQQSASSLICPSCGTPLPSRAVTCPRCGSYVAALSEENRPIRKSVNYERREAIVDDERGRDINLQKVSQNIKTAVKKLDLNSWQKGIAITAIVSAICFLIILDGSFFTWLFAIAAVLLAAICLKKVPFNSFATASVLTLFVLPYFITQLINRHTGLLRYQGSLPIIKLLILLGMIVLFWLMVTRVIKDRRIVTSCLLIGCSISWVYTLIHMMVSLTNGFKYFMFNLGVMAVYSVLILTIYRDGVTLKYLRKMVSSALAAKPSSPARPAHDPSRASQSSSREYQQNAVYISAGELEKTASQSALAQEHSSYVCPRCGAAITDEEPFCGYCGTDFRRGRPVSRADYAHGQEDFIESAATVDETHASPWYWYKKAFKKYSDFSGRAGRKEYWFFFLVNFCIITVLETISRLGLEYSLFLAIMQAMQTGRFNYFMLGWPIALVLIYCLISLLPSLAAAVRRLHDVGRSGAYWLLCLIPIVGPILLIVLLAQESVPGDNEYGPNPESRYAYAPVPPISPAPQDNHWSNEKRPSSHDSYPADERPYSEEEINQWSYSYGDFRAPHQDSGQAFHAGQKSEGNFAIRPLKRNTASPRQEVPSAHFPEVIYCPYCAYQLPEEARFCENCGKQIG